MTAPAALHTAAAALDQLTAAARAGELDSTAAIAAVTGARRLAASVEAAELAAIDAARAAGATWNDIAAAIGATSRQGAQKRRADLARRVPPAAPASEAAGGGTGAAVLPAGKNPAPGGPLAAAGIRDDAGWLGDEEYSRTLRHHPVAGLGPEWTWTGDDRGNVVLWRDKTVKAGGASRDYRRGGWEGTSPRLTRIRNAGQPSRVKALRAAAAEFEHHWRKVTPAGPDVPLPGAAGWVLRQTLADRDERRWQVIAPDDATAGTVGPSYTGARSWTASHGDPAASSYYPAHVSPAGPDEAPLAAGDGLDWKTRDAAAYAVAHWHDPENTTSAAAAVAAAAARRQARAGKHG